MIQRTKIHGDIFPIPDDKARGKVVETVAAAAVVTVVLMASILSKTKV